MLKKILEHLAAGGAVRFVTYCRAYQIDSKVMAKWHATGRELLTENAAGELFMALGKGKVCILPSIVQFSRLK